MFKFWTPHSMLHFKKNDFSLLPWVFGCVCFVYVYHPQDKLSLQALKCRFFGYFRTQKGYKCFYPPTNKFYVSENVTFLSLLHFFSKESASLGKDFGYPTMSIPIRQTFKSSQVQGMSEVELVEAQLLRLETMTHKMIQHH